MIIAIILSIILLLSPSAFSENLQPLDKAPDFTLMTVKGDAVSLQDFKNNALIFIYWKPDHERSILALKDADKLSKAYAAKGVRFIAITAELAEKEKINALLNQNGLDFQVLLDPQRKVYSSYEIRVYPTTVLIDKDNKFFGTLPGHALTYYSSLEGYIKLMLGEIDKESLEKMLTPENNHGNEAEHEAERNYNLALNFASTGMLHESLEAVKKSIEAKPDIAKSHTLLGFLLLKNNEPDPAIEHFNKALELEPDSKDAKTGQGAAYALKNEPDKAIEILSAVITANPYPQMSYYYLGMAHELKGEKDPAIEMYKKSLHNLLEKGILPSSFSKCK
ncbi:MAG: redoxin domain-containing protein [Nitrospirae bacterium]|nr:redoxin domain-containing protein [Nitrospirota bacterium]